MKCLNVIIYYKNIDEVCDYIDNCIEHGTEYVDIALVINSKLDSEEKKRVEKIKNDNDNLMIFDFGDNVGYLNSLLLVIQKIDINDYEYFILSNTDIAYETPNFYHDLLNKDYPESVGCIAPSVYSTKAKGYSNPHYKERVNKRKYKLLSFVFAHPLIGKTYLKLAEKKYIHSRSQNNAAEEESCYVYSPHGCFMIFTKSFIKEIYGYVYGVKLYSEEACVGELLRKKEMKCYFDKDIRVSHNESTVTGKINYKIRFKFWKESIDYILKEFY